MEFKTAGNSLISPNVSIHNHNGLEYITYYDFERRGNVKAITTLRSAIEECDSNSPGKLIEHLQPGISEILSIKPKNFIAGRQIHSNRVFTVSSSFISQIGSPDYLVMSDVDGFITCEKNIPLIVFTADCLPVFLYEQEQNIGGLVHAGRKGTEYLIVREAVKILVRVFGANPGKMIALIGASIGPCCYPVDLWSENTKQLEDAGVASIENPCICTGCNTDKFYSYRVEKGISGRMVSVFMLK